MAQAALPTLGLTGLALHVATRIIDTFVDVERNGRKHVVAARDQVLSELTPEQRTSKKLIDDGIAAARGLLKWAFAKLRQRT